MGSTNYANRQKVVSPIKSGVTGYGKKIAARRSSWYTSSSDVPLFTFNTLFKAFLSIKRHFVPHNQCFPMLQYHIR